MPIEPEDGKTQSRSVLSKGTVISHYRIIEKLGEGGMGLVYKAEDTKLGRTVALKFLVRDLTRHAEAKRRFIQEAQTAAVLNHPNICTIHEIDETEGQIFIAMECVEGQSLKGKMESSPLKLDEALGIAIQVSEGLQEAHEKGIVHQDIKSANIMVTAKGQAKIMDFGLAKLKGVSKLTRTGTTVGTTQYMSPEQAQGIEADQRSDIFSFGVVLYETITGQLPFKGEHEAAVIYSIVNETPEPLARYKGNVPEGLQRIVDKALQKDLSTRYQSAAEVIADLKELQKGTTTAGLMVPPKRKISRSILFAALTVLIVMAGYVILSRFLAPSGRKSASIERKSIAVLPFKNMVSDPENEWFSDGITEDIITQLSKIGELRVISRTSVMLYKDSKKRLREIGKELDVATILEGSVRRADNRVRIVGQLVDARTEEHIWAETYDREMKDIFDIQSDVAKRIAIALKAKLSPEEKERLEKKPTENLTAYDYYLKGREYFYRYHKQDNENAIRLFKKALELDPAYTLALAGLGDAYAQRASRFGLSATWVDSAIDVSRKAISIDPNCAEAHKALGLAYACKGWLRKALQAERKAVELNPNYFPAVLNLGCWNYDMGEYEEALKLAKKAVALNPTFAPSYGTVGLVYMGLEEYAKAELWFNKALELQPDFIDAHGGLIDMYLAQGKYDQATAHTRRILSIGPEDVNTLRWAGNTELTSGNYAQAKQYYEKAMEIYSTELGELTDVSLTTHLAYTYWKTDQEEEAGRMFSQSLDLAQKLLEQGNESWVIPYNIAAINAIQGNKKEAYLWLQKAIDAGWRDYRIGSINPLLESLHKEEKFKQMMAEVKAMVDEMRKRAERE